MNVKHFIFIFLSFLLISCSKEDSPIASGAVASGFVRSGAILTDEGISLRIEGTADYATGKELPEGERIIASFDVLGKDDDTHFGILLRSFALPLCKDLVPYSDIAAADTLGHDPITVMDGWYSGGYMNLHLEFSFRGDSKDMHLVNLVYDDSLPVSDTLRMTLRHNGHGEGATCPDYNSYNGYSYGAFYASFPVSGLIPAGKSTLPVKITSSWFTGEGDKTEPVAFTGKISR